MTARGKVDYRSWLIRVLGWDGLIPVFVALVSLGLDVAFPKNREAVSIAAAFVLAFALFFRGLIGNRQIASNCCSKPIRFLQYCVFAVAIMWVMMVDLALILAGGVANLLDLLTFVMLFGVYLILMIIPMYPGRKTLMLNDKTSL